MSNSAAICPLNSSTTGYQSLFCCNNTILKVSLVIFGVLLIGGAIASHIYQVNAIVVYTMGGGGGCLILGAVITSIVQCTQHQKKSLERKVSSPLLKNYKQLNDKEIIENLHKQGYKGPFEEGADGRCLFWSIAPQITDADIAEGLRSKYASYFAGWDNLPLNIKKPKADDRLDRLRQMALAEEEDFVKCLPEGSEALTPFQRSRIFELYKDMVQELQCLCPNQLRQHLADLAHVNPDPKIVFHEQFLYCKKNFHAYKSNTCRKYNWAGTSELIAIGLILKRGVQVFGKDLQPTTFDLEGNVLPFYSFSLEDATNPMCICIFQINGGGHYRGLKCPGGYYQNKLFA